jgi:hypothetical protein
MPRLACCVGEAGIVSGPDLSAPRPASAQSGPLPLDQGTIADCRSHCSRPMAVRHQILLLPLKFCGQTSYTFLSEVAQGTLLGMSMAFSGPLVDPRCRRSLKAPLFDPVFPF